MAASNDACASTSSVKGPSDAIQCVVLCLATGRGMAFPSCTSQAVSSHAIIGQPCLECRATAVGWPCCEGTTETTDSVAMRPYESVIVVRRPDR